METCLEVRLMSVRYLVVCSLVLIGCIATSTAQQIEGLVSHYSFDDCAVTDDTGQSPDGLIFGDPQCGCGPEGNALYFDGVDDYVDFQSDVSELLAKDFTASFYFQPQNVTGLVDIFSRRKACAPDSAVSIRYEPATRRLRCELTEGITERAEVDAIMPLGQCWYHITWVRSGNRLLIYLDGKLASEEVFGGQIDARNTGILSIANSPCLGNGEERFRGALDEFKVFDRALTAEEIATLPVSIDELITQDTIVFRGDGAQIRLGLSCAPNYLWTPINGIDDVNSPEPFIAPDETTTYGLVMDYGFCRAGDTVRIIVVDSTELDCNDVFLPNAFTPNQDGLNDIYGMSNGNFFLGDFISLSVYDRWGSKLYEGRTSQEGWDGTINGEEAMPGVYVYKLRYRCNGEEQIARGSFNLLR